VFRTYLKKGAIMAVENVVCPHCGSMQYGNVPSGQRILKVNAGSGRYQPDKGQRENDNKCTDFGKKFYTICIDL
jgi:hypothetical protein